MRLFIAINLSDALKDALIKAQNEMHICGMQGNYTKEENLHLTLAFIGDYSNPEPVMDALASVSFAPFELKLQGIGCFGDLWWAGIKDSAPLDAVVRRIRKALNNAGIPFDRKRFSPHITLLRKADGRMPGISIEKSAMTVERISLMRSDRGKNGMIYTEIGTREAQQSLSSRPACAQIFPPSIPTDSQTGSETALSLCVIPAICSPSRTMN